MKKVKEELSDEIEYLNRIKTIQSRLYEEGIRIALVTEPIHTGYLCDIRPVWGPLWILIPAQGMPVCLCPEEDKSLIRTTGDIFEFYFYNAYDLKRGVDPIEELLGKILSILRKRKKDKSIAVGIEKSTITYSLYCALRTRLKDIKFKDIIPIFQSLRKHKSKREIEAIQRASEVAIAGEETIRENLKVGITEAELLTTARYAMEKKAGKPITLNADLLSGPRTLLVGGTATGRRIEKRDLIIADLSPCVDGYFADMSRTYFIGNLTKEQKRVYKIVMDAKETAVRILAPGIACAKVERVARQVIEKAGYARFILHHAGHQIGRENFELPAFVPYSKDVLEEGMVMTVEIGIYVPDIGGVRIEDDYLITKNGSTLLSHCS